MGSNTLTLPPRSFALPAKAIIISAIFLGVVLNFWMAINNDTGWGEDFNQFYAASHLAGTGQIYNWDALRKAESVNGKEVPTGRLPVVLYGAKIVSWLPYSVARLVWLIGSILALAGFAWIWPGLNRSMTAVALAWSMAAGLLLVLGQDTPFWLLLMGTGLFLLERGSPRLAGIAFALCICKFHLTVGVPILLLAQKRWSALVSAAITGTALLCACFLIEGSAWPAQYLEASKWPSFSPAVYRMPNLNGVAYWFPQPAAIEIVLSLIVVCLLWMFCRRSADLGLCGAAAAASGLVLAHHCYANDCAVLIPLLIFTMQRTGVSRMLKIPAALLLSPASVLLLTTPQPWAGQFLVAGFVIAALAFITPSSTPAALAP